MATAELDEVVELRAPAVGPVLDVMGVDVPSRSAAGKAAAAVARMQRAAKRGRDAAGLAAEAERPAVPLEHAHDRRVAREPARGFRRQGRAVVELAAPAVIGPGQRVRVDVHQYLVPVPARACLLQAGGVRVRDRDESVGPRLRQRCRRRSRGNVLGGVAGSRRRSRGNVGCRGSLPRGLLSRGVERGHQQRALLGREPCPQQDGAVVVVVDAQPPIRPPAGGGALCRNDAAIAAQEPLELRRGRMPCEVEEIGLPLDVVHARERPHLRVAELALAERGPDQRKPAEPARHPHVLARGPGRDAALPGDPVGARLAAPLGPALARVVLGDELQPPACRRVDLRRQRGDLPFEHFQRSRSVRPVDYQLRTHVRMVCRPADGTAADAAHGSCARAAARPATSAGRGSTSWRPPRRRPPRRRA